MLCRVDEQRESSLLFDLNDILYTFQKNTKRTLNDHLSNSQRLVTQGIKILLQCYESINDRRASDVLSLQFEELVEKDSTSKIFIKKTMTDEASSYKHSFGCPIVTTGPGFRQSEPNRGWDDKKKDKLSERLSRIALEKMEAEGEPMSEDEDAPHFQSQGGTMEELLQSTRKFMNEAEVQPMPENNQQYDMTDYSSNESSNNNSYHLQYIQQDVPEPNQDQFTFSQPPTQHHSHSQPTPGLFLTKPQTTNKVQFDFSQFSKLNSNFIPGSGLKLNNIMNSPMKSMTKRKRLYCRKKKIPTWAEDLKTVLKGNDGKDPDKIFGRCIVENLNAEYLFEGHAVDTRRTSSAKWTNDEI